MTEVKADCTWEKDIQIAGDGSDKWAVISLTGMFRFHDECPCVVRSDLESHEAAEVARRDVIGVLEANPHDPFMPGPIETQITYKAVGRVLQKLKAEDIEAEDLIGLAFRLAAAAAEPGHQTDQSFNDMSDELPF